MVAVHLVTAVAHKETAKQAILKRLREAGATSAVMPSSVEVDSDDAQAALADLLATEKVKQARPGLFYLAEVKDKDTAGSGFLALLIVIVALSLIASVFTLAATLG